MYKYNLKVALRKGLTIENAISYRTPSLNGFNQYSHILPINSDDFLFPIMLRFPLDFCSEARNRRENSNKINSV